MRPEEAMVEEKRQMLLQYMAVERSGHDYFRLHNGSHFEGYILDVGEATVLFEWAPSLFDDSDAPAEPFEIPLEEIDIRTLK